MLLGRWAWGQAEELRSTQLFHVPSCEQTTGQREGNHKRMLPEVRAGHM